MPFLSACSRDPLIFRDSRPFGGEGSNRHRPLAWPLPQTFAGAVRTLAGRETSYRPEDVDQLLSIEQQGPLPCRAGRLLLPFPSDLLWSETERRFFALRPVDGAGTIRPAGLPGVLGRDGAEFKPSPLPPFVPLDWLSSWLCNLLPSAKPPETPISDQEERVHTALADEYGTVSEGQLFLTNGMRLANGVTFSSRLHPPPALSKQPWTSFRGYWPLGGERRLAWFEMQKAGPEGWVCPVSVADALKNAQRVRLMLATPALFSAGWLPAWLRDGKPVPGTNVCLTLVGASVGRWIPVSGWSYDRRSFGEKALRRLAPSGCMYFCQVTQGQAADLPSAWLSSVSDEEQDRRDGYGLALWGTW